MDNIIKFRAWDGKRMYNELAYITMSGNAMSLVPEVPIIKPILMQFTGLYDCEGKEIYEGDIVKGTFQLKKQDPVNFVSPVDFSVLWGATVEGEDVYSLGRCRNIEILGNIYEHPNVNG